MSEEPSTLKRILNFSIALTRHIMDGMQKRTQEEITFIYENHCSKCETFDPVREICTHGSCGCRIIESKELFSKLAWKSEFCPRGFWK